MSFIHLTEAMQACSFMGETNKVLIKARSGNLECAKQALEEYSALIMGITGLLDRIMNGARAAHMPGIEDELKRNIEEEEGTLSDNVPHCIIIAEHFKHLGLQWPFGKLPGITQWQQMDKRSYNFEKDLRLKKETLENFEEPTQVFIQNMWEMIEIRSTSFTIGMALALETTAGPELQFVARIINELLINAGLAPISEDVITSGKNLASFSKFSLNGFFAHHIHEWEYGHQNRLEEQIQKEIDRGQIDREMLDAGFITVLSLMDSWWGMLAKL